MIDIRRCYTCGKIMHWRNFLVGSHNKVQREHFTSRMIEEIWDNPIFVLKCCHCYNKPFFSKEFLEFCKRAKERREKIISERRKLFYGEL